MACYHLTYPAYFGTGLAERSVKELMEQGPVEQLDEKLKEINFAVGIASLTIARYAEARYMVFSVWNPSELWQQKPSHAPFLPSPKPLRYLTDHAKALPLGVVNRMANTCDVLLALIPLIDNPPWVRRHKGKIQKFQNNRWETVERSDRLKITKLDGQVWTVRRLICRNSLIHIGDHMLASNSPLKSDSPDMPADFCLGRLGWLLTIWWLTERSEKSTPSTSSGRSGCKCCGGT